MQYRICNKRIQLKNIKTGVYHDFCEEVYVKKVITDLFDNTCKVEILIENPNRPIPVPLPRSEVDRNIIKTLRAYGFSKIDMPYHSEIIGTVLADSEASANHSFVHNKLGFHQLRGTQVFLAHNPIGLADPQEASSEYCLPKMTKACGTYEEWHELIKTQVLGKTELELALALSAVAPIAHILTEQNVLDLVPVIAFIGESSTSKTTMLKMIGSVYSAPNLRDGILSNLNATQNAFQELLSERNGFPTLIDETTILPEWDFASTLYNIPTGRGKLRCDSSGHLIEPKTYSGCIFLTGESSLFEQLGCSDKSGIRARVLQFQYNWAGSPERAEAIEKGCRENYGTAVYPLIEWLIANQDDLAVAYKKRRKKIKAELAKHAPQLTGISERVVKMYTLILLGAGAIKAALNLDLNYSAIKNLLIKHFFDNYATTEVEKEDPIDQVYEYLLQVIAKKASYFPSKSEMEGAKIIYGIQDFENYRQCVWVMTTEFKSMLQAAKKNSGLEYKRDKDILDAMHTKNYILRCAADRFPKRVWINGKWVSCYGLLTGAKSTEDTKKTEEDRKSAAALRKQKMKERLVSLLDSSDDSNEEVSES